MMRYLRQIMVPEIGETGQEKLRSAHILVVGAGGLGCPALQYLVGAGVGKITLVDHDVVSLSNLHRQTLYRTQDINQPKVEIAAAALRKLNPDCEIIALNEALTASNIARLAACVDVVLDCADSFAVSYILSDTCYGQNTPLVSASALGLKGYVGGFCGGAPSLRAVFPELPQQLANCNTSGVSGPIVGAIGALQAQMTINILIGLAPSPLGQLTNFDFKTFHISAFRFDAAEEPTQNIWPLFDTKRRHSLRFFGGLAQHGGNLNAIRTGGAKTDRSRFCKPWPQPTAKPTRGFVLQKRASSMASSPTS